ncbi:uncharacterized protein LOC105787202 [Gossypium raimondii]|uniref:Endoplasmic reticulum transmembrane protein n=1 Tax=Gossypium raimondii TaxID=29730 RepID=A0A0D2Q9Y0_GOSRA|nr:uncharacterized protein LOC105787202 [Gossypium raimondii]KJB13716.1 hypothetical protein B456_002G090900 [Gossypium raimondii]MBA0580331.1 hypothetical protein [Gossypium raimondii]
MYLLSMLVLAETVLVLGLIFSSPLRELVMRILDIITVGKATLILKTVAATLLLVFTSMLYDVIEIKKCWSEGAVPNPADEILMAKQVLKASMWFALFLALATYGLHYCIKGLEGSRRLEAAEDNKQLMLEPPKNNATSSK